MTIGRAWWCRALVVALAFAAPLAARAQVPDALTTIETFDGGIVRDGAEYARRYHLPPEQAERDLRAQIASVPLTDAIAREFAGRLVGISVVHAPQFGVEVLLTGDDTVPARTLTVGDGSVAVTFRTGAAASQSEIVSAITRHQATIRASLTRPPGIGLDVRTGEMVVLVGAGDAAQVGTDELARRFTAMTGMPVRVEVAGAPANMMVGGGLRVTGSVGTDPRRYLCTTGFAVTDGVRTGVATAAHCPDDLRYVAPDRTVVALPFVGQFGWGYQDVQINETPADVSPGFYADTAKTLVRTVAAAQARASTRAGDFVCHRGERTGYSCAEVLMTDFAPAGDLCGGACLPTWVAVEGPTCQGGDSGAPVFSGTTALGLVKGGTYRADGSCAMYYYMSVDYLPRGWSLLRDAPLPEHGAAGQNSAPAFPSTDP